MRIYNDYDINNYNDLFEIGFRLWSGAESRWMHMNAEEKIYILEIFDVLHPDGASLTTLNDFIWFESDDLLETKRLMTEK